MHTSIEAVQAAGCRHMSPGWSRVLRVGLTAGLLMNVLGWIGNQLLLGPLWKDAIQTVVPLRSRTWVNEVVSLVPDLLYGVAIAWLVWKILFRQEQHIG